MSNNTPPRFSTIDLMEKVVAGKESLQLNLILWEKLCGIHPDFSSPFERNGKTFTAISHIHGRALMTALFGPQGTGWGYEITDWTERRGILSCMVTLWYKPGLLLDGYAENAIARVSEYGGTRLDNADDDVCKKTVTDALSRCFMALGHGADIHAGLHDSSKYLDEPQKQPHAPAAAPEQQQPPQQQENQQQPASGTIDDYVKELIAREPLFGKCDYRVCNESVYFLTGVGNDKDNFVRLGFKESQRYPGGLFLSVPLPEYLRSAA